jgi:dTDP-4-amino-4,6-dideoxygalactose transaminase
MCGVEAEAVIAAGFAARLYRVEAETLQASCGAVEAALTPDTAAVLVTHYFGFPQRAILDIRDRCSSFGAFLIEDCAHALGSCLDGQPLGTIGDLSFFSLRKSIPVPHGGALVVNRPELRLPVALQPSASAVSFDLLVYLIQRAGVVQAGIPIDEIYRSLGHEVDRFGPRLPKHGGYDLGLSVLARLLFQSIDVAAHLDARRAVFRRYGEFFRQRPSSVFHPLYWDSPNDVSPPFFPAVVAQGSERGYNMLSAKGCTAPIPFWSLRYERAEIAVYPEIAKLKEQLMILPLTDPLTDAELGNAVDALEEGL